MYFGRTLCDVLHEMRKCHETHNYTPLMGLIEEAQIMGNRMEDGLGLKKDADRLRREIKRLRKKKRKLEEKVEGDRED